MATAYGVSRLRKTAWNIRVEKDSLLCHVCGNLPKVDQYTSLDREGITLFITCPERHGIIETVTRFPVDGDLMVHYRTQERAHRSLVDQWNQNQQEARNAAMFPGKPNVQG